MKQLTISEFIAKESETRKQQKEQTTQKVINILEWKNKKSRLKIEKGLYKSYEIEINKYGKITAIKFVFKGNEKKRKFQIQIQSYTKQKINEQYWWQYNIIKDIKLGQISEKAKVWYKEWKQSINYFRYLWLDKKEVNSFIKYVLLYYHQ